MPTQHDFRAAAGALRTLATTAGSSAVAVNDVHIDVGLSGGTATAIIDAAMNAAFLHATAAKTASTTAADEFDRRSEAYDLMINANCYHPTDLAQRRAASPMRSREVV